MDKENKRYIIPLECLLIISSQYVRCMLHLYKSSTLEM